MFTQDELRILMRCVDKRMMKLEAELRDYHTEYAQKTSFYIRGTEAKIILNDLRRKIQEMLE